MAPMVALVSWGQGIDHLGILFIPVSWRSRQESRGWPSLAASEAAGLLEMAAMDCVMSSVAAGSSSSSSSVATKIEVKLGGGGGASTSGAAIRTPILVQGVVSRDTFGVSIGALVRSASSSRGGLQCKLYQR